MEVILGSIVVTTSILMVASTHIVREDDNTFLVNILDEAITLKRYYKEASRIRLQPENPDFQPIYTQDVRIAGTLSSIARTY